MPGAMMDPELPVGPQSLKETELKILEAIARSVLSYLGTIPAARPGKVYSSCKSKAQQNSTPSNVLALPGYEQLNDMQKGGLRKGLVVSSTGQHKKPADVGVQGRSPKIVPGHVSSARLYGKAMATLTHHKNSVRAMAPHPTEESFVSASCAENIKKFKLPKGDFMHNMLSQQKTIINSAAVNEEVYLLQQEWKTKPIHTAPEVGDLPDLENWVSCLVVRRLRVGIDERAKAGLVERHQLLLAAAQRQKIQW